MTVEQIFLSFLECQKTEDPEFKQQVKTLAQSLDKDGDLETDGHSTYKMCLIAQSESVQAEDEDLCRRIGAQLAAMGDQFQQEGRIKPQDVESLINDILMESLTEDRFAAIVQSLLDNLPPGLEQEKACLVVAMTLTSKVGESIPNLLQSCYTTAVSFIRRNYMSYIARVTEQR